MSLRARMVLSGLLVLGVILMVAAVFAASLTAKTYSCAQILPASASAAGLDGSTVPSFGGGHVAVGTKIRYANCPPTSGLHYAAPGVGPLRPGYYGPEAVAGPGGWVHNLEHGFVVVLYRGDTSGPTAETLASLRTFARDAPETSSAAACGYSSKVLVARFDDMSTPFALLAWDRLLPVGDWDEAAARAFAEQWIDVSAPEPGAC